MNELSSEPQSESSSTPVRTQWHRILGTFLELLLSQVGITVQTEAEVMSEPPKVDIVLLRRENEQWTSEQSVLLCDGLRNSKAGTLLVEFKYSESLNADALLQALGYDYFYRQAKGLGESELQSFIMLARSPQRKVLEQFGYQISSFAGVYHSEQPLLRKISLIVLNQLQLSQHNAFVQCFASQRRIYQSAFQQVLQVGEVQLSERLWALIAGLQNQRETKGVNMVRNQSEDTLTAEKLIQIGKETRKLVLASLSPEDKKAVVARMTPEERLAGLAPEERLAGLAPEEMAKLLAQLESFLQQQGIAEE